jgi:hypothetical protein
MADQIAFRAGQKQHFIAARTFALGKTGVSVPKGTDVLYDGSVAVVGGAEYQVPEMRGAIRAGWLVPEAHFDENDMSAERPIAANIQVRPADGGNPMHRPNMSAMPAATETDEREVGNTASHARAVNQRNTNHRPQTPISANPGTTAEMQDGIPVRRLKTASGEKAKHSRTVLTAESAGSAIRAAENVQIDAGQGVTEEEMLDRMAPEARDEYLAKKDSIRARYVDTAPQVVSKIVGKESGRKEQAGMTSTVSTARGSQDVFDAQGHDTGKAAVKSFEQDGIKFTTTNGPSNKEQPSARSAEAHKPVMLKDGSADVRRMVAKQLCQDFPVNYQFEQATRKKLARLQADYEDRPDVIRAVFAAESDEMKSLLIQEFPQAFSG